MDDRCGSTDSNGTPNRHLRIGIELRDQSSRTFEDQLSYLVIPARGGSKRVPGKNLKRFRGTTVLAETVGRALVSLEFSRVIVSTDSHEIAKESRFAGADVPFIRDSSLADDYTGTLPVALDAAKRLALKNDDILTVMYSTSMLKPETIRAFMNQVRTLPKEFHLGVKKFTHPIERRMVFREDGSLLIEDPEQAETRTQDLPERYFDCGKIYSATVSSWQNRRSMLDGPVFGFEIPLVESFDADTPEELDFLVNQKDL